MHKQGAKKQQYKKHTSRITSHNDQCFQLDFGLFDESPWLDHGAHNEDSLYLSQSSKTVTFDPDISHGDLGRCGDDSYFEKKTKVEFK